jgi:gliding motility-associated-like protein
MTMPDHVCAGQTKHYYVNPGRHTASTYEWWINGKVVPGKNTAELSHTWDSSGTYLLEVQETSPNGCQGLRISGLALVNPQPEIQITVNDTLLCNGEIALIHVENPTAVTWGKWMYDLDIDAEPEISGHSINHTYSGPVNFNEILFNSGREMHKVVYTFMPYILNDEDERCCEGKEVKITLWIHPGFRCRENLLNIPNAFSPNGDGINDVWNIIGKDSFPDIEVTIYNRWGQAVWKSARGYPVPWDGRSLGKALPVDSYHYLIELHDGTKPIIGNVTLVR